MKIKYSERLTDAFSLAQQLHRDQVRKCSHVPYITHLMGVSSIIGDYGGDEDQVIAGLLHDAMEDQGGRSTLDRIREKFGDKVADYVDGASDSDTEPKTAWLERKTCFIESMKKANPDLRLIVAADKIHNGRSIIRDLLIVGNDIWRIFFGGRENALWYFDKIEQALSTNWEHPILHELHDVIEKIKHMSDAVDQKT